MTKDQNLETCRSQVNRLQGELKLMSKENAVLHERLNKCNSEVCFFRVRALIANRSVKLFNQKVESLYTSSFHQERSSLLTTPAFFVRTIKAESMRRGHTFFIDSQ